DFFATLISGDNNPDLRENIHQVLPYGLAGMFAEGLRSMFTGILRGYDDQKTPALINILMTWLFTVSAIGAVIGNAPLTTINLFRNIGAPLMVSAILAQRLYKRIQEDHRPHCAFLQNFTIFRRAQPEQNVAQAVQIVEEGKDQDKKAFFAI
ncbi:MAG TPA: hypothetical protein VLH77_07210, partial [Gammaproteobacteria bacterium]|nr:hypothetical protein [Gammaproteobacteria bacterium]